MNEPSLDVGTPIGYYAYPAVSRTLLHCWGCPARACAGVALPSPDAAGCLGQCSVAYLAVSSKRIAAKKQRGVPASSINRRKLPAQFQKEMHAGDGALEIHQPLGYFHPPPEQLGLPLAEQVPERTTLFLDIELFNEEDTTWIYREPEIAFSHLEGTYEVLTAFFVEWGIDAIVVMSGRGYHVVSQVTHESPVLGTLIELGHSLSPEIRTFLDNPPPDSKREEAIPWNTERAFWGARQLEHYIYTQTIQATRRRTAIPVEISDRGHFAIAFDPTSVLRNSETAGFGTPGSLYIKPQLKYHYGGRYLTRSVRAVVAKGELHEYGDLRRMLAVRENYDLAAANLSWLLEVSPAGVPDSAAGIERLVKHYRTSELARFHEVMNQHYRLDAEEWEALVADLGRATLEDGRVGRATARPHPALLDPTFLNGFIFGLYERWQPQHGLHAFKRVEFVLSAFYYNEPTLLQQFNYETIDWGKSFNHEVPQRHAQGWVMLLGGQLFEQG